MESPSFVAGQLIVKLARSSTGGEALARALGGSELHEDPGLAAYLAELSADIGTPLKAMRLTSAEAVNRALKSSTNHVTAIGTTVVRAIETSLSASNTLKGNRGWTDKFIYPPYDFVITERLITNFHMPKSTLLMLVAAFADYDFLFEAYQEAIDLEYRLFSFGDAMLIL